MITRYNSELAADKAEQLNASLQLIFEKGAEGIQDDHPLICNAFDLSGYISSYFIVKKETENDQHS